MFNEEVSVNLLLIVEGNPRRISKILKYFLLIYLTNLYNMDIYLVKMVKYFDGFIPNWKRKKHVSFFYLFNPNKIDLYPLP